MLKVKFCGLTRAQDARLAVELGVDAIGLIFYEKSARYVNLEAAHRIIETLPPWTARVGVFVDAAPTVIRETIETLGLTAIQLHGNETTAFIEDLRLNIPVVKALSASNDLQKRVQKYNVYPILVDHALPDSPGGTGSAWDWSTFNHSDRPRYFILAGGLNADNVGSAVRQLSPDAVDVSSGIERSPGIKDSDRMKAFVDALGPYRVQGYRSG